MDLPQRIFLITEGFTASFREKLQLEAIRSCTATLRAGRCSQVFQFRKPLGV